MPNTGGAQLSMNLEPDAGLANTRSPTDEHRLTVHHRSAVHRKSGSDFFLGAFASHFDLRKSGACDGPGQILSWDGLCPRTLGERPT